MMNKKRSSRLHLLRYLLLMPVITLIVLAVTSSRGQSPQSTNIQAASENIGSGWKQADVTQEHTLPGNTGKQLPASNGTLKMEEYKRKKNAANSSDTITNNTAFHHSHPVSFPVVAVKYVRPAIAKDTDIASVTLDSPAKHAEPLYIINGKESDSTGLKTLNPSDIASVSVLKGPSAVSIYGEKGQNGLLLIKTKSKAGKEAEAVPHAFTFSNVLQQQNANLSKVSVPHVFTYPGNSDTTVHKPLYIIDGKIADPDDIKRINSQHINFISVSVFKGKEATTRYGEKGKNGVILIKTKARKDSLKTFR